MYFMADTRQHNGQSLQEIQDLPLLPYTDNNPTQNNYYDVDLINRNLQLINLWIEKIKAVAIAARQAQAVAETAQREAPPNCREYFNEINTKIGNLITTINTNPVEGASFDSPQFPLPDRQAGGYLYPTSSSRKSKKSSRNRKKRKNKKSRR